jgi:tetratricopeptide (TPR) repeat protein
MTRRGRAVAISVTALALSAISLAGTSLPTAARTPDDADPTEIRVDLARQAAAAGAVEDAIRIYEEILTSAPDNDRAFWGLVRLYSSSEEYQDKLLALLSERLERVPDDVQAKMELGDALARSGDHEGAHALWSELLSTGPADAARYAEIGSLEVRHRMYEQALDTFLVGRAAFRSPSIFSQELTQVHALMGNYDSAIDECVVTVESHPGAVPWATNRVEMMLAEGADRGDVRKRMRDILERDETTAPALSLAGSVFLVLDMPDRALEAYLRADELSGGHGEQLLEFGTILRDEGLPEEAREAYLMVVERYRGQASAARAGVAAAGILAEMGRAAEAVAELRAVADAFERTSVGAQALYEGARIELGDLNRPEAALATVRELRERFGPRVDRFEHDATLIEIDANMRLARYDAAYVLAERLAAADVRAEVRESSMFALGFVSLLKHDMGAATQRFREMVEDNASGKLVNDALRLMLVIALAQEAGNVRPVELLADAHAARMAKDDAGARELLQEIVGEPVGAALEAEALLLLGALAADSGDLDEAIGYYDRIVMGTEGMTARAEAMMRKGDLLAKRLNRRQQALDAYEGILEMPLNPLSGEARRKIDRLRKGEGVAG